jgi:hypothetical protein
MFALADLGRIEAVLTGVGWQDTDIEPMRTPVVGGGLTRRPDCAEAA